MAEQAGKWRLEMRPLTPAAGARQFRASDWCGARGHGSQPCTRAASGLRPEALRPPAGSRLTIGGLTLAPPAKARPDAVRKTPRWSAGRRGVPRGTSHTKDVAPTGAPSPLLLAKRGEK